MATEGVPSAESAADDATTEYLASYRIPEIMQHLSYALVRDKPTDPQFYTKKWLWNVKKQAENMKNEYALPTTAAALHYCDLANVEQAPRRASRPQRSHSVSSIKQLVEQLGSDELLDLQKHIEKIRKQKEEVMRKKVSRKKSVKIVVDNPAEDNTPSPIKASSKELGHRRIGVSATPVEINRVQDFQAVEIPKTDEERKALETCVSSSTLFTSFEEEEKEVVVKAMEKFSFKAGDCILRQGEPGKDTFYLIMMGSVEVIKNGKVVATMSVGQYFGELELMYNTPECAATIQAISDVETYGLEKDTYQNIVLHSTLARRDKFLQQINSVDFFRGMPEYDKMTLAEALSTQYYEPDDHLIRCGEGGQWMFMIMEGTVKVVGRKDGKQVEVIRLGPGNVVGELEFLFNHNAVADVVAVDRVKVAKLNRKHFEMCMGPMTDNLKRFIATGGDYEHYLGQAGDHIKKEIEEAERREKMRLATEDSDESESEEGDAAKMDFSSQGEIVFGVDGTCARFNLNPASIANIAVIGIREDGTVTHWNETMVLTTNYQAEQVIGQSIYPLLLGAEDQKKMHSMIRAAKSWAIDGTDSSASARKEVFTFSRNEGMTKATMSFVILPPVPGQKRLSAKPLLIIGYETRKKATTSVDFTQWVFQHIKPELQSLSEAAEAAAADPTTDVLKIVSASAKKCVSLVKKLEPVANLNQATTEAWNPVNIRGLTARLHSEVSTAALRNQTKVSSEVAQNIPEEIYMDSKVLPNVLEELLQRAVHANKNVKVALNVSVDGTGDGNGIQSIVYEVKDDGVGIPASVVAVAMGDATTAAKVSGLGLRKVRMMVQHMGGVFSIESSPGDTTTTLTFPLIAPKQDEAKAEGKGTESGKAFTTVMLENQAVHRNMLCHHLWERHHAVMPATSWKEVSKLLSSRECEMLIVDPDCIEEELIATGNPITALKEYARSVAIIVASETFDEELCKQYDEQGLLALPKPCSAGRLHVVVAKAEEQVMKIRAESDRISQLRETFNKTNRGQWKRGKLLGKGAFGEVFEATDVLTGGKMAVKALKITDAIKDQIDELINEIEVMTTLQHESIIHYFYCEKSGNVINIFMECAAGGTLQDVVRKYPDGMEPKDIALYLRDVLNGVAYIHANRFVHCDLKTANVLLDSDGHPKIGDFGTAKQLKEDEKMWVMRGTPQYMAPEVMNADIETNVGFDYAADIWSIGCIVLEMATGKPPFYHIQSAGGPMGLLGYISDLADTPDLSPLFGTHPFVFEFVKSCLEVDPANRPTAKELMDFALLTAEGEDSSSAVKILNRAKLLYHLNKFVAFEEDDNTEEHNSANSSRRRSSVPFSHGGGDFFDTSDEDEEEEEEDEDE